MLFTWNHHNIVNQLYPNTKSLKKKSSRDFPAGPVVKNPRVNAGNTGSVPHLRGSRMPQGHSARSPALCNKPQRPLLSEAPAPQRRPHSPQLGKAHVRQWRPSSAQRNTLKLIKISMPLVNELNKIRYPLSRFVKYEFYMNTPTFTLSWSSTFSMLSIVLGTSVTTVDKPGCFLRLTS